MKEREKRDADSPLVSIVMLTYYAEDYVEQAIESVLAQQTTFPYELIISDDNSQDGTVRIIKEYRDRYPDIIRLQLNSANLGIPQNLYNARCLCRGRFITGISGDDYWIDDHKLETQTEYLIANPDRFAVGCVLELRFDDDTTPYDCSPRQKYIGMDITLEQNLRGCMFSTGTVMMRNVFLTEEGRRYYSLMPSASRYIDDGTDILLMLNLGPIHILNRHMVAHRVQRSKIDKHNFTSLYRGLSSCEMSIELLNYVDAHFDTHIDLFYRYRETSAIALLYAVIERSPTGFMDIYRTIPMAYKRRGLLFKSAMRASVVAANVLLRRFRSVL